METERTIKDEVYIAIYAIRYAYTRKTYAPSVVSEWVRVIAWHQGEKEQLIKALREEEKNAISLNLIDEINQPYWDKLVAFLEGREPKEAKNK